MSRSTLAFLTRYCDEDRQALCGLTGVLADRIPAADALRGMTDALRQFNVAVPELAASIQDQLRPLLPYYAQQFHADAFTVTMLDDDMSPKLNGASVAPGSIVVVPA